MRKIEKFIQEKLKINSNSKIINDINDDELLVKLLFDFIIDHKVHKKDFKQIRENQFNYSIVQHTREVAENFYNEMHKDKYKNRFILIGTPFGGIHCDFYFEVRSRKNQETYIMLNINNYIGHPSQGTLRSIDVSKNIMELLIKK
ncbi:hypothetical protein IKN40_07990 [bacterium]|nr:hypothetical protein [bacterium]